MHIKPRHKRRIFWFVLAGFGALILSAIFIPPFINLNDLKPKLENSILEQTGFQTKINGNVNFSLLGPVIVAHDITIPQGNIKSLQFSVNISDIFNIGAAEISDNVSVYGANLRIDKLIPPKFNNKIEIYDSVIGFMGKDYNIINGNLYNGLLSGTVRTPSHKYEFDSNGDEFHISNKNNNLRISGRLYSDGTASGTLEIDTNEINDFFEFSEPKITSHIKMKTSFEWDGKYGFKFDNIAGDNFNGQISLSENGHRDITIYAKNVNLDISFLLTETNFIHDTSMDLDLTGNLNFGNKTFNKIKIKTVGDTDKILIQEFSADDLKITGGKLTANGAIGMPVSFKYENSDVFCAFSGNPENWKCEKFKYENFYGDLIVEKNNFKIKLKSDKNIPNDLYKSLKKLSSIGDNGIINFAFPDSTGYIKYNNGEFYTHFDKIENISLVSLDTKFIFLPEIMRNEIGTFTGSINDGVYKFTPNSKKWSLTINNDRFELSGVNLKQFIKGFVLKSDLSFIKDNLNYSITGNFKNNMITGSEIKTENHSFTGTINGKNINLKTKLLNLDSFTDQNYVDNYDEKQFLNQSPITVPFEIDANVSISADSVIYNGNEFKNFVYSLKNNTNQTFSITDNMHGNLLIQISKNKNIYDITLQLNKFDISGNLLSKSVPLNISDTKITTQANLKTNGKIGYDIWNNLSGDIDISFEGGILHGIGTDRFYSNVSKITMSNAENMLSTALTSGESSIKKLHIVGKYTNGNFETSSPFILQLRHTDIGGNLKTENGKLSANMNIFMRGTSPDPKPINLKIMPNGKREFSLSEIMQTFDSDFLGEFTKTHEKF